MDFVEIKKELEKYGSLREKVLRLNEIGKFKSIVYGSGYVCYYDFDKNYHILINGSSGCRFCHELGYYNDYTVQLKIKNRNVIEYFTCKACSYKKLCAYCLHEKENCTLLTKKKITFILSSKKTFPKDIRKLITNLFFKN